MGCGCQYDAYIGNEGYAAEQGIERREEFTTCRFYFHHRAHTAEYHRCIVQGIYPRYAIGIVIAQYAYYQAHCKYGRRNDKITKHTSIKDR